MFIPKRIIVEKDAMKYPMTKSILSHFKQNTQVEILNTSSNRLKQLVPGEDLYTQYREGKRTLVIGIKKSLKFQTCRPSAHYQLPLVTGCMGQCEYCYLNTQLGDKPFVKVYANVEEILEQAQRYTEERLPKCTIFEGAATSDPVAVEPYTHSLQNVITWAGQSEKARFRFVTKYKDVDSLLSLPHNDHTEIRFSLNTTTVIEQYEHATASRNIRIEASKKVAEAGYPVGFIIAPVFLYPNWREEYHALFMEISWQMQMHLKHPLTFEIISHRYTTRAKNRIIQIYPETMLPMQEEERSFKYGQFGYGKYVYPKEELVGMKDFFEKEIKDLWSDAIIKYII